ncbi:MAG: HNH endonuclease [Ignavibacteriae bacterium]|nr:HNH endonuclease [Ignavibacteriota bacterium]
MSSKYLSSLSPQEYDNLTNKLFSIQDHKCYICLEEIDLVLQTTNIDHIIPLANKGKDSEDNFALTHENCNKSKLDADLRIARLLFRIKKIQDDTYNAENKSASLKHILINQGGSKFDFNFIEENGNIKFSLSEAGDNAIYTSKIFKDRLSKEKTCFIEVPIEYIYHDEFINPRGINNSISGLIKEFNKGNPQLHLTLARIQDNKIRVFDGQHKAIAQILLGVKKLLLRVFIEPDVERLTETNKNAGGPLRQIAFDKSIMRQLSNTLYHEKIKQYQIDHNLEIDDFSFSEQKFTDYFKGERSNIKKYIIDSIKYSITDSPDNKLKNFIDRGGKSKELPISYSALDKSFLSIFIDSKNLLNIPINYKSDEGLNPRELEITQIINLMNIIAEELYINKYSPELGVGKIENKIVEGKDTDITDEHLIAYRISKEEIIYNWIDYLKHVIINYFGNTGKKFNQNALFQIKFDDQLWTNLRNFLKNLTILPVWKDRTMAATIFSGKRNYDFWKNIFSPEKATESKYFHNHLIM